MYMLILAFLVVALTFHSHYLDTCFVQPKFTHSLPIKPFIGLYKNESILENNFVLIPVYCIYYSHANANTCHTNEPPVCFSFWMTVGSFAYLYCIFSTESDSSTSVLQTLPQSVFVL